MDDAYLYAAKRDVELNPVRAKLVPDPTDHRWGSVRAHVTAQDDVLVKVQPLLDRFGDWPAFLASGLSEEETEQFRSHERTCRPLGTLAFVDRLERLLRRVLRPQKRGPNQRRSAPTQGERARATVHCPQNSRWSPRRTNDGLSHRSGAWMPASPQVHPQHRRPRPGQEAPQYGWCGAGAPHQRTGVTT